MAGWLSWQQLQWHVQGNAMDSNHNGSKEDDIDAAKVQHSRWSNFISG
jgi:hypothetical protein